MLLLNKRCIKTREPTHTKKLEKRNWYNKFFVLLNIMYGIKIKMWTCDVCTNVS
jgi:hypothetical protein